MDNWKRWLCLFIAGVLSLCAGEATAGGFFESFEEFTGESGTTVNGFTGDKQSGTWYGDNSTVVMVGDGTAYSGKNYLRVRDTDSNQHHLNKIFSELCEIPSGGARLSFALRRGRPASQTANDTGFTFRFKVTDSLTPGNVGTQVLNRNLFPSAADGVYDVWFIYEMNIIHDSTDNKIYITDLTVKNSSTDEIIYSSDQWYSSSALTANHDQISILSFFTWGNSQGYIDIDAFMCGEMPDSTTQTVTAHRPSMPYRAIYGVRPEYTGMTLGVPGSGDRRILEDFGMSGLYWNYGTQISWNAGSAYWEDACGVDYRTIEADTKYPYDFVVPGIALDEWVGSTYPDAPTWIRDGLRAGKDNNTDVFIALWSNGWNNQIMYDLCLDNTIDLLITEGYTRKVSGGSGGTWSDALREVEYCSEQGLITKTILGLGALSDLPNYGNGLYWDEESLRGYMSSFKEEYPRSPGVAFFPDNSSSQEAYAEVVRLAASISKEYWPDNWLPEGVVCAITPQAKTTYRVDAANSGTSNGTQVIIYAAKFPQSHTNQQWRFKQESEGVYRIHPSYSSAICLDVDGASSSNGALVQLYQANGTNAQKWRLVPSKQGFKLEPLCAPGKYLRVTSTSQGSRLEIREDMDDKTQIFSIIPEICPLDPIPPCYHAEDAVLGGGAALSTSNWGYTGSGYVNMPSSSGASITFNNVDGLDGGNHEIIVRYSCAFTTTKTMNVTVNGVTSTVTMKPTTSWSMWHRMRLSRNLNAGTNNTIVITSNSTGDPGSFDKITIEPKY